MRIEKPAITQAGVFTLMKRLHRLRASLHGVHFPDANNFPSPVMCPSRAQDRESWPVEDLARILQTPKHSLPTQFRKLVRFHGADLTFTDAAIKEIARIALERGTGVGNGQRGYNFFGQLGTTP